MGGGPAGSLVPPHPHVVSLTAAPHGGWTIPMPGAYAYNGKTYFTWVNGTSGATEVAEYAHDAQTISAPFTLDDFGGPDNHNNASVMVRKSDKRLIAAYAQHDAVTAYLRISTNPEDATAWQAYVDLDAQLGSSDYTYMTLVQLRGVANDPIYLFYRDFSASTGRLAYSVSTDDGATWSARTLLYTGASGQVPYWEIMTDWDTRIDIVTTSETPGNSPTSGLYHFYLSGGNRYKTDGTIISAALPLVAANITLIEANTDGEHIALATATNGTSPASLFMVKLSSSNNSVRHAIWNGSAWVVHEVCQTDGVVAGNQYASSGAIGWNDPYLVYTARKVGSKFEMFRYTSADGGVTWAGAQLTVSSSVDHMWAEPVVFAEAALEVIWLSGTYASDTNNNFGISGYSRR
jgi:Neuraminidase (sialidase)